MIVSQGLESLGRDHGPSVTSIGVFDGVHLGHRAILERNREVAAERGLTCTVVTFAGHPKRVLLGRAPRTLTSLQHRLRLFEAAGVQHTLVLRFDETLRSMRAKVFLDTVLLHGLDSRHFVLGFDSKFGLNQEGGADFLQACGQSVEVVPRVAARGRAISSTAIREAVELGDLVAAGAMLGRRVSVLGRVVHGDALGRRLGFPTANLDLDHELHPPTGVYAGFARCDRIDGVRPAMANIGVRPSLAQPGSREPRVEVHLIGYEGDLYGQELEFEFAARLREEQAFADLDSLRVQLAADQEAALHRLQTLTPDFGRSAGAQGTDSPAGS
ncbi:MAG: riboflavin biosynthesis protein RibF [Planctomycetota bacterium]